MGLLGWLRCLGSYYPVSPIAALAISHDADTVSRPPSSHRHQRSSSQASYLSIWHGATDGVQLPGTWWRTRRRFPFAFAGGLCLRVQTFSVPQRPLRPICFPSIPCPAAEFQIPEGRKGRRGAERTRVETHGKKSRRSEDQRWDGRGDPGPCFGLMSTGLPPRSEP